MKNINISVREEDLDVIKKNACDHGMSVSAFLSKLGRDNVANFSVLTDEIMCKITDITTLACDVAEKSNDKVVIDLMTKRCDELWSLLK